MPTETYFKIRNPRTGLFSKGGYGPKWDKKGKLWKNIGHVKNHLKQVTGDWQHRRSARSAYQGCEVVEIVVNTEEANAYPVLNLIEENERKEAAKQAAREDQRRQDQEARERAELARLQRKYGASR